ncbi:hypothetical protein NOU13_23525 [Rhodococcus erythropolis]|uniref:hypothetical protein n=1 Tax=Rhodococcus erythropolis TaxID=1833 RepID=UPI00210E5F9A|nr:hypothetical protein [Rhodococcus erythropolis]MCQ4127483.1 hypothetical protein [Rhodococcus erythropolis]
MYPSLGRQVFVIREDQVPVDECDHPPLHRSPVPPDRTAVDGHDLVVLDHCHLKVGWSTTDDAVLCNQCDFAGCANAAPIRLEPSTATAAKGLLRCNIASPLANIRGLAGHTRAISAAIRIRIEQNLDIATVEERIAAAEAAGRPLSLWSRHCHSILTFHVHDGRISLPFIAFH